MQQPFILAIRQNDSEQLATLLATATESEKANAALLAAYTNKATALEQLIANGADVNQVDKDGQTCLHWAVGHNNSAMIELLLQHGAENKPNKSGDTPAHYAENKDYLKIFNVLVQHFLVAPFKFDDADETMEGDLILQNEVERTISANTLQLLIQYRVKKSDIDQAGIEMKDLEKVMNPSILRRIFRFLISGSIVRTLLLWPFMHRGSIKLYEDTSEMDMIMADRSLKQINEGFSDLEKDANQNPLLMTDGETDNVQDMGTDTEYLIHHQDQRKTIEFAPKALKKRLQTGCSFPILTSYALPFESETTQKIVFFLTAFHATVEESFEGIWSLLWISLLIHGVINFYQYPEENKYFTFLNVLGFNYYLDPSSLIFNKYQVLLADALDSPVLSFVVGVPVLFGLINAIRAARDSQILDHARVTDLIQQLRRYKAGFFSDGLGWLFSAALPNAFPPLAFCYLLPQPAIKQALEKIQQRIIWDGRLSAKDRLKLFDQLCNFAHQRSQFTQMKALSILATIINGIDKQTLSLLQEEGVSNENIKALLFIKARSLHVLDFLANHYNLPGVPKSLFRPFLRYLYANYLMWQVGYPQQWLVQPLFYIYRMLNWYFLLQFYFVVLGVNIIRWISHFGSCDDVFPYFEHAPYYSSSSSCLANYLRVPRTFDNLMAAIEAILPEKTFSSMEINLSAQKKLIQMKKLPAILNALSKLVHYNRYGHTFILQDNQLSLEDMQAIGNFIALISESTLDLSQGIIEAGGISVLVEAVKGNMTNIQYLNLILSGIQIGDDDIRALFDIFPLLSAINLKDCNISARNCMALSERLSKNKDYQLTTLNLADNLIDSDCAEIIAKTPIINLNLGGINYIGDKGIESFAESFNNTRRTLVLRLSAESPEPTKITQNELILQVKKDFLRIYYLDSLGVITYREFVFDDAYAVNFINKIITRLPAVGQQTQDPELIKIITSQCCTIFSFQEGNYFLSGSNVSDNSLLQLLNVLPRWLGSFHYTDHKVNGGRNFSLLIPRLVQILNETSLKSFGWNSPGGAGLGNEGVKLLADELIRTTIPVRNWDLSDNQMGPDGMQALARVISFEVMQFDEEGRSLILRNNNIGSGLVSLAENIAIQMRRLADVQVSLDVTNNDIIAHDICGFSTSIQQAYKDSANPVTINSLSLAHNSIGDQGIINLMKFLNIRNVRPMKLLNLSRTNMSSKGAIEIIKTLSRTRHTLWIEVLFSSKEYTQVIEMLDLSDNFLDDETAQALCSAFARTKSSGRERIILTGNPINETIIENCGLLVSEGHSLYAFSPYVLTYRFYRMICHSFSEILSNQYHSFRATHDPKLSTNTTELVPYDANQAITEDVIWVDCEDYANSSLYISLLSICETFLQAVRQSVWLTAIPTFAGEILYCSGGYARDEIAKFKQDLETLLIVSITNSPNSLAASWLARWLASHLRCSPQMVSTLGAGTALITSVLENSLAMQASLRWTVLKTGVALMGSLLGTLAAQKIPEVGQQIWNKLTYTKACTGSSLSFWSAPRELPNQSEDIPNTLERYRSVQTGFSTR